MFMLYGESKPISVCVLSSVYYAVVVCDEYILYLTNVINKI